VVSRRDWLKLSLAAGAGGLLACSGKADSSSDGGDAPLDPDHALCTFEVSDTSAIVSAYAANTGPAQLVLKTPSGSQRSYGPLEIMEDAGNTGALLIEQLEPDTLYTYFLSFPAGTVSSTYRFRTAPALDADKAFSFVISADIDVSEEFDSPIFESMASTEAEFFVCLGDWPYADNPPGAETIEEFRARHKEVRVAEKIQRVLQRMPVYAIYDDHEMRNNWDAFFREREATRIQNALTVWDEWFPLRAQGVNKVRYRSWRWGQHAEFFMLDTRLYRSANDAVDDTTKTMLGATQKQWLFDGLRDSTATFKFILNSVPLDFAIPLAPFPDDYWGAFTTEREELLAYIRASNVDGVLWLTADQHWFAAHHYNAGHKEFQLGPLARGIPTLHAAAPEVVARSAEYNFGELVIEPGPPTQVIFNCRGATGELIYTETIAAG